MGLAGVFGAFVAGQRAEDDAEVAVARHFGRRIRLAIRGDVFDELVDHLEADFFVRFLASAKAQLDANFHVIAQELDGVVSLGRQVVRVNRGRDLKLFHYVRRLAGVGAFIAFGFLVEEFAVIDDAANGRRGVGRDLDEVQAFGLGQPEGFIERHDAELLFGVADDADFAGTDFSVAAMQGLARMKGAGRERAAQ